MEKSLNKLQTRNKCIYRYIYIYKKLLGRHWRCPKPVCRTNLSNFFFKFYFSTPGIKRVQEHNPTELYVCLVSNYLYSTKHASNVHQRFCISLPSCSKIYNKPNLQHSKYHSQKTYLFFVLPIIFLHYLTLKTTLDITSISDTCFYHKNIEKK